MLSLSLNRLRLRLRGGGGGGGGEAGQPSGSIIGDDGDDEADAFFIPLLPSALV